MKLDIDLPENCQNLPESQNLKIQRTKSQI